MGNIFPPFLVFLEVETELSRLWINLTLEAAIKEVMHFLLSPITQVPKPQQTLVLS
jgi:hypothetical protein